MGPRRRQFPWLLAFALACTTFAQAETVRWAPFGPGGGAITSLAVGSGAPAALYAVAGVPYQTVGTVYKSTDGGVTWQVLVHSGSEVVAVDPEHPSTVYTSGYGILRSRDGGRTWSNATPPGPRTAVFRTLAAAPGGVVLAGEGRKLWRSANGGQTWTIASFDDDDILSIAVDPSDPRRIYHASSSDIYRSTDAGEHWTVASERGAGTLALAPSAPATLYFLLPERPEVFRSDDGAATWRQVGSLPRNSGTPVLLVDPASRERVYAASRGGMFTSTDGGSTWIETEAGLPRPFHRDLPILSLATNASSPGTLYAGTEGWGVARSADAGARWRIGVEPGLNAAAVWFLKFHPLEPDTVYVGLAEGGTRSFRSADGGRTWQPFARSIAQDGLNDLAFDPVVPDILYASSGAGFWRSADAGETWQRIASESFRFVAALGGDTLVGSYCGLHRSTDGGLTWKEAIACYDDGVPRAPQSLWTDPASSDTLYIHFFVANGASIFGFQTFKSQDGGATWQRLRIPGAPAQFTVAPSNFQVLYASDFVRNYLLRSVDGGKSWKVVKPKLPSNAGLIGSMAVDATSPDTLYLSNGTGLLVSHDGGATFKPADTPIEAAKSAIGGIRTDRTRPGLIYATSYAGLGLFVRRVD